jgi:UDP-galactopyranose mutase
MRLVGATERILIVGAGPCGLACGRELERLGHRDWLIAERDEAPGGLASSVVDPAGFTWDLGGHVVFSHFGEFDALLEEVMGEEIWQHDRSSYVRFGERWVPYPFQNNLRHLPPEVTYECLVGLIAANGASSNGAVDFATWMNGMFGDGITRHFMEPYNFKVWATPAGRMAADWIAERVSVVDYKRALENVVLGRDDVAWGPNNTFVFPAVGGTGEIYRRLGEKLGERVQCSRELVEVDPTARIARFNDGSQESYKALVSTMPLDLLVDAVTDAPDAVREAARVLEHNSVYVVGVGYEAPVQDSKSWMYFPDRSIPFYRATNFAKYSPANVPDSDTAKYCSYMTETSYSPYKAEARAGLEERVEAGLRSSGVIDGSPPVATVHVEDVKYAYPVPTIGRDAALSVIQPWLMERGIYARGRFGAWRYEIGNMDHAVKMGIDVSRLIVGDEPEELWRA